jgi:Sulfatase
MRWALLTVALVLLNLSLTFVSVWPTLGVRASAQVSLEAAVLVLGLAAARAWRGRPVSARSRGLLAAIWVVLVIGRYVDVTTRSLYGRSVNLYWDLKLLPDVGAMFAFVAQPAMLAAAVAGVMLVPVLLYLPVRWAIGRVSNAGNLPRARRALIATSLLVLSIAAARSFDDSPFPQLEFASPVSLAFAGELTEFAREATGLAVRPLPPAPDVQTDLAHVRGADVFILFVESYGAASWERPEFQPVLAPAREQLTAAIRETGRDVVSAFVESTTFGGESWLAHISLLSGTEVRDPDVNMRLMAERRDTMVTAFARRGYTTAAIMPGLLAAWPDGAFYGFDHIYGAADLKYAGPPFGWWDVTDQYVIARMDEIVIAPQPRQPAFVFLPTISTHAPFTPVPPYQPDWRRILTSAPYDEAPLAQAYDITPDWDNLGPGYARSMAYVHDTLGGYLRLRADRDFVMVILGDHQPPALVSGEGASWAVPVHVVTGRAEVLERLHQHGFRDGLVPAHPSVARMDTLMRVLLDAFGNPVRSGLISERPESRN